MTCLQTSEPAHRLGCFQVCK